MTSLRTYYVPGTYQKCILQHLIWSFHQGGGFHLIGPITLLAENYESHLQVEKLRLREATMWAKSGKMVSQAEIRRYRFDILSPKLLPCTVFCARGHIGLKSPSTSCSLYLVSVALSSGAGGGSAGC